MQPLHTPEHKRQRISSSNYDSGSSRAERLAQDGPGQMASRHEPEILVTRVVPTDPYTAWLSQREAERHSSTADAHAGPVRQFGQDRRIKAPWEAILVTLTPDNL